MIALSALYRAHACSDIPMNAIIGENVINLDILGCLIRSLLFSVTEDKYFKEQYCDYRRIRNRQPQMRQTLLSLKEPLYKYTKKLPITFSLGQNSLVNAVHVF